ncbi:MAG: hypothetical protein WCX64_05675 [Candidatus Micrarchaeia archaeon]
MVAMCAKTLGELKHSYSTYFNESKGTISAYEDGLEMDAPRKIMVQNSYIIGLTKVATKAMNKVVVRLDYYDMFGSKNAVEFMMHEDQFRGLKVDLKK